MTEHIHEWKLTSRSREGAGLIKEYICQRCEDVALIYEPFKMCTAKFKKAFGF
jgi:hypothetical protein